MNGLISIILPLVSGNVPSGGVMALVSVLVVFTSLAILYAFYSLTGTFFKKQDRIVPRRKNKRKKSRRRKGMNPEIAAAISLALQQELGAETYAAIGTALHMYLNDTVHDNESYVLTIRQGAGAWAAKGQTFRQDPNKK